MMNHPACGSDSGTVSCRGMREAALEECTLPYLFSLHCGGTAIPSIIVAEGSIVDGITVIVSHEGLLKEKDRQKETPC